METIVAVAVGLVLVVSLVWLLSRLPLHPLVVLTPSRIGRVLFWAGFGALLVVLLDSIWLFSSRWMSKPFSLLLTFSIELIALELIIRLIRLDPPQPPSEAPARRAIQQALRRSRQL